MIAADELRLIALGHLAGLALALADTDVDQRPAAPPATGPGPVDHQPAAAGAGDHNPSAVT